jgi:hypothetical protein
LSPPDDPGNPTVNFHGEKRSNDTHESTTDPDARLARKGSGKEAKLSYNSNLSVENRNGIIVDTETFEANGTAAPVPALGLSTSGSRCIIFLRGTGVRATVSVVCPGGTDVSRLFALALMALSIASGRATGIAVRGKVVDETNAPVAGARVRFSPQGTPEVVFSDADGAFAVELPAFGHYSVQAAREQLFPLHDHPVDIVDDRELLIILNHQQERFDSVKVMEDQTEMDLDRKPAERSLKGSQILDVPTPDDRYLRNAFRLMPGVVQDIHGSVHFAGGAENQVRYTLDGFNIGDPVTGAFNTRISVDAVRSVDYATGSVSPDAGKGSAGAVSIQTKMGDDRLRYTATNFIPGVDFRKGMRLGALSPRLGVSGPLKKGRLWFSDNLDLQYMPLMIPDLPRGQDTSLTLQGSNLARVQGNVAPANILYGSLLVNYLNASNTGLGPLDPVSTTTDRRACSWFFSLKDQIALGHGTLAEIGYAETRTLTRQIPQGDSLYLLTPTGHSGNYFVNSRTTSGRDQLLSSVTMSGKAWGKHQVRAGIDLDKVEYRQDVHRTGYEQFSANGVPLWRTMFEGPSLFGLSNAGAAWYLMDAWTPLQRVHVEYGVRQDWDRLGGRWELSPKMSAAYAPWSQTRFSAAYGVSHDETSLLLFSQPLDQRSITMFLTPDGTPTGSPSLGPLYLASRGLGNGSYQNLSLGVEQRIRRSIRMTANVLRKRGANGLTYVGQRGNILLLESLKRDTYDSADITVQQTLDSRHEWSASYSRSRALSNAVQDINVDQTQIVLNNFGRMGWDVPDRFTSWGYLPTPLKRWSVAYLMDTHDGSPFSVNRNGTVVGGVNSRRFPAFFELDFHVECRVTLLRKRLAVRAGFNNITDHKNPTAVNGAIGTANYLKFYGSDGRHFVVRLRALGKE